MPSRPLLRIATRGSGLAVAQADVAAGQIRAAGYETELTIITTRGDRSTGSARSLAALASPAPGLFVTEVEQAVVAGRADVAVHSYKDLPLQLHPQTCIAAVLARSTAADVLLVNAANRAVHEPLGLRRGCVVGTSSPRRAALLSHFAPQTRVKQIRGNVTTRLRRCVEGEVGAVVLAAAGIERLGVATADISSSLVAVALDPRWWHPAPAQGALAVQARAGSSLAAELASCDHQQTRVAVALERDCLAARGGGCGSVLGAFAESLATSVTAVDGQPTWRLHVGFADGPVWQGQLASGTATQLQREVAVWAGGGALPGATVERPDRMPSGKK